MYRRGMVALSGDPVHLGHEHLFQVASSKCQSFVIYITDNDEKRGSYLYSQEERVELIRAAGIKYEVVTGNLPLVDMYLREGCDVLFRGIRNESDKAYEDKQMSFHKLIYPHLNVQYILANPELVHISSTLIKSFAWHHVDVSPMVRLSVKASLEKRMHKHLLIGVTGCLGSGKSYLCERLSSYIRYKTGHVVQFISIDDLIQKLFQEATPGAQLVRDNLNAMFQDDVLSEDSLSVDKVKLIEAVTKAGPEAKDEIWKLILPHVHRLYRERLATSFAGTILVDYGRLLEDNLSSWTNNVMIVVDSPNRDEFARSNYSEDFISLNNSRDLSTENKIETLRNRIRKDRYGRVFTFSNVKENRDYVDSMSALTEELVTVFPSLAKRQTCQN